MKQKLTVELVEEGGKRRMLVDGKTSDDIEGVNFLVQAIGSVAIACGEKLATTEFGCHVGCGFAAGMEWGLDRLHREQPEEWDRAIRHLKLYLAEGPQSEMGAPVSKTQH